MKLKFPTSEEWLDITTSNISADIATVSKLIDYVYDEKDVFKFDESTPEEQAKFIDHLSVEALEAINLFFATMPKPPSPLSACRRWP